MQPSPNYSPTNTPRPHPDPSPTPPLPHTPPPHMNLLGPFLYKFPPWMTQHCPGWLKWGFKKSIEKLGLVRWLKHVEIARHWPGGALQDWACVLPTQMFLNSNLVPREIFVQFCPSVQKLFMIVFSTDRQTDGHTNSLQNKSPYYPIQVGAEFLLYLCSLTLFCSDKCWISSICLPR